MLGFQAEVENIDIKNIHLRDKVISDIMLLAATVMQSYPRGLCFRGALEATQFGLKILKQEKKTLEYVATRAYIYYLGSISCKRLSSKHKEVKNLSL